jgi:hypothetical protein
VTPKGLLHVYPETSGDLFSSFDDASKAIQRYGVGHNNWTAYTTTIEQILRSKRYLRWQAEVKNQPENTEYKEPRRSLEETYAIYAESGMDGLKALYSKSHCFHLLEKFKGKGWKV